MKFRQSLKKAITLGALAASLLIPAHAKAEDGQSTKPAEPVLTGNIEGLLSQVQDHSYVRFNGFYKAPLGIKGYTFIEFYQNDEGFFGKTNLTRKIAGRLQARSELVHVNEPLTRAGFGVEYKIPMPNRTFANVKVLPVYIDNHGRYLADRVTVGYFAGVNLPKGWTLSSFGEGNINAKGTGGSDDPKWGYGEIELSRAFGPHFKAGYIARLLDKSTTTDNKFRPKLEHTLNFGVRF